MNHVILLKKLSVYGVRGNALSWFESYLKNRRQFLTYNGVSSDTKILQCGVPQGSIIGPLSDHDFYNITLASPTTDYKDERMNEWIDEWMSMKKMEMWVNEGTNEWTSNEQYIYIYILRVNIEWMSWWMPQNSRWCEWTSKYNAVYSSYDAHDNTVHVYLCLFTSDRLRGIHNASNPLFTKLSLAIYHQ